MTARGLGIKAFVALVALLIGGSALLACQGISPGAQQQPRARSRVSVALDWYPWSNHVGLFIAKSKGYYEQEGLDVEIYVPANPEDVLKLVGSGKDTFGISYHTDVLFARAEGVPVKSVAALVQHPLNSIMTLRASGLTRPGQLEGKRVGTAGLPSDEAYLAAMMASDGADPNKVEIINVGYDLVPALIGQKVDAIVGGYWVHESILAEMKGHPVNVMRVEQYGVPDYYELVLVASDDTTARKPDVVRRFLKATARGYQDAMNDQQSALDELVRSNPEVDRQLEERGMALLAPLWTADVSGFGRQTPERWQAFGDWLKRQGLLKADADVGSALASQFQQ